MSKEAKVKKRSLLITVLSVVVLIGLAILVGFLINKYRPSAQTEETATKQESQPSAQDRILVKFKENVSDAKKNEIHQKTGGKVKKTIPRINVAIVEIPSGKDISPQQFIATYKRFKNEVEYAELDYSVEAVLTPNDPYYSSSGSWGQSFPDLWGIRKIQSASAWDLTSGSTAVIVAVIDTGIDYNHPDLKDNILRDAQGKVVGYDFVNNDADPIDDMGHGTHCAGTIGAVGNNALGVVGVNWKVKIMPVKFLDSGGSGYDSGAADSIIWAVDHGARVLSNSWGGSGYSRVLAEAITYAYDKGTVFVAAAGNDNQDASGFVPASDPHAITVSAFDYLDLKAFFSNYGLKIDVAAPGVDVLSLKASAGSMCGTSRTVGTNYCYVSGTSMATPHVAGLAALILAKNPSFTNEQVRQAIRKGADDVSTPGLDIYSGFGRINSFKSLQVVSPLAVKIGSFSRNINNPKLLEIKGTAAGPNFSGYELYYSKGSSTNGTWILISSSTQSVTNGVLGQLDLNTLEKNVYVIKLVARNATGEVYEDYVKYENTIHEGNWPIDTGLGYDTSSVTVADLEGDGKKEIIISGTDFTSNIGNIIVYDSSGYTKPGWPREIPNGGGILSWLYSPSPVGDLDGDGKLEIVIAGAKEVNVLRYDGTTLSGWPFSIPTGKTMISSYSFGPTIGDVDGDGKNEVAFIAEGTEPSAFTDVVYVVKGNGKVLSGFPVSLGKGGMAGMGTALSDLNGDGKLEVLANPRNGKIYAYDWQGKTIPGWPKSVSGDSFSQIASGDVDGDGRAEVFVATATNVYGWRGSGSALRGWPVKMGRGLSSGPSPVLGDIDHDNLPEVVVGLCNGCTSAWAWNADGKPVSGWPCNEFPRGSSIAQGLILDVDNDGKLEVIINFHGTMFAAIKENGKRILDWPYTPADNNVGYYVSPSVTDLEGDGELEFVAGVEGRIYVWDLPAKLPNNLQWPLSSFDLGRSGFYKKPIQ